MIDPLAVLIYSHKSGYQALLERQLKKAGISRYDYVLENFTWHERIKVTGDIARANPKTMLIFLDAWDQILLGTKEELLDHAQDALVDHVTLAGEKECWPDDRRADYERRGVPGSLWRYVNSNPLAGFGSDIARAIEYGLLNHPLQGDARSVDDPTGEVCERFWTKLYLDGPESLNIRIDSDCKLNQVTLHAFPEEVVVKGGRMYNTVTGTTPIFAHLNGGAVIPDGL